MRPSPITPSLKKKKKCKRSTLVMWSRGTSVALSGSGCRSLCSPVNWSRCQHRHLLWLSLLLCCRPAGRRGSPCPEIHPSLSPLACYCLKHRRGFMNSLRHFHTFLFCWFNIWRWQCMEWWLLSCKQRGCQKCRYGCMKYHFDEKT